MPKHDVEEISINPLEELLNIPNVENVSQPDVMYAFDGKWLPSVDPALIGARNYQKLVNMRYSDTGIEGVTGYTEVNTTPITTYVNIKNGIYFKTQDRTVEDYVLVQAQDGSGNGRIYQNQTAIGSQGDFSGTHIASDSSVNLVGRFSQAPAGSVAYSNTEDTLIWDGEEGFISSAFTTTDAAEANPIDVTEELINSRTDSDNIATIDQTRRWMTILTRRPVQGFKVYIETANTQTNTISVNYWDGTAYQAVSNLTDGTLSAGKTLAQTGAVTFDDTTSTAKLKHFEERYLYAYQIILDSVVDSSANISEITANMSMQKPTNVWDGVYRTPIQCQVETNATSTYEDFTIHVSESSSVQVPVGCILDGFTTSDKLTVMFDEPMSGIRMTMLGNLVNTNSSTVVVKYWNGSGTYQNLTEADGTSGFSKSGLISWHPASDEKKVTLFGTQGYAYEITVTSSNISGTKAGTEEVVVDLMSGVPAQVPIETYKFPLKYKSKLMLCGYTQGNEGNRIDYSEDNAPDIFNGENTSLDGFQSLYIGGTEHLTCGAQLYNRFGSNLFASLALFKVNEIYLLMGDSPIDYQVFPVSQKIGCPAPLSLDTAEVGVELGENVARNVAMFVSNSGPMMYDGATLAPIRGLDKFFDPNESTSVNFDYLDIARGWYDSTYREYNILLPVGESQTTLNYWLCYDIVRKKWFQKDTGVGDDIQCGINVVDSNGDSHVYGGSNSGTMYQLENGASWSGTAIQNEVQTGDFFPSENEWDITRIRRLKFSAKRLTESGASVEYYYYGNTDQESGLSVRFQNVTATMSNGGNAGVSFVNVTSTLANSSNAGVSWSSEPPRTIALTSLSEGDRLMRSTISLDNTGWAHSFRFVFSSSSTLKGLQPIMWGFQWELVRKDHNDP